MLIHECDSLTLSENLKGTSGSCSLVPGFNAKSFIRTHQDISVPIQQITVKLQYSSYWHVGVLSSGLWVPSPAEDPSNVREGNIAHTAKDVKLWAPCVDISTHVEELSCVQNYPMSYPAPSLIVRVTL